MHTAAVLGRGVQRLAKKYNDLKVTSGSPTRATWYVVKYLARVALPATRYSIQGARHRKARVDIERTVTEDGPPLVAFKITGGIGDMIVAARYIRDLLASVEPFRFDVYCKQPAVAEWIFSGFPQFRAAYLELSFHYLKSEYAAALWTTQFVLFYAEDANWSLIRQRPKLAATLQSIVKFRGTIDPIVNAHPYLDGHLSQVATYMNRRRADFLHGMSDIPYGGDELALSVPNGAVSRYSLKGKRFITLHNGFDPDFIITADRATKCYRRFAEVVQMCRTKLPDVIFVQIGTSTSQSISGVHLNLLGRTTLQETAELIQHAALHVDNESGLVHLARCLGKCSLVLFGPTPLAYFAYQANINMHPPECGGCWWINQTWMDQCPRGQRTPVCMQHDPADIADTIIKKVRQERLGNVVALSTGAVAQGA